MAFQNFYWAFVTATTVGYGDFRPTKRRSKLIAILTAVLGLLTMASSSHWECMPRQRLLIEPEVLDGLRPSENASPQNVDMYGLAGRLLMTASDILKK
ncbi:potassium channel family protein [Tunturiibacter gelidoferens]|uniref:potassium channel family protein n=1 Tax=Tunturiibacter gelidiferens TaxID=3069689 RepID=UPI0015CEEB5E